MKRIHIVIGAIAVISVVAAGAVALTRGDDSSANAPSAGIDPSRSIGSGDDQAEQLKLALEEQARLTAEISEQLQKAPHKLRVTIREESPYDAYKPESNGYICVRATDVPSQLVVEDASGTYPKVVAESEIPGTAKLKSDGACEATITVDVPHVSQYRLGIAIEGHGISQPTDPGPTEVKVAQSPQKVVVLR